MKSPEGWVKNCEDHLQKIGLRPNHKTAKPAWLDFRIFNQWFLCASYFFSLSYFLGGGDEMDLKQLSHVSPPLYGSCVHACLCLCVFVPRNLVYLVHGSWDWERLYLGVEETHGRGLICISTLSYIIKGYMYIVPSGVWLGYWEFNHSLWYMLTTKHSEWAVAEAGHWGSKRRRRSRGREAGNLIALIAIQA